MPGRPHLAISMQKAATYLASQQLPNGGFMSYTSSAPDDFRQAASHQTTFFPSVILLSIIDSELPTLRRIKVKIAHFLQQQKSPDWTFNYWDRTSQQAVRTPYPDDLDDTFLALSALYRYQPGEFDGQALATITKLLVATEQKVGGPYRTWLVDKPESPWDDVDVAVNANIGYFLSLQNVQLPSLTALIKKSITRGQLQSRYYPTPLQTAYFITRWNTDHADSLRGIVAQQPAHRPMHKALQATILLNLKAPLTEVRPSITSILDSQAADGSWPATAFCIDPDRQDTPHYAGAASLTTALCLQAIGLYAERHAEKPPILNTRSAQAAHKVARTLHNIQQPDLRHQTQSLFAQIQHKGSDKQITQLPWLVQQATGAHAGQDTLAQLATANLWGWIAYTALDDIVDGDRQPIILPAAIYALRQLTSQLARILPGNFEFQRETTSILDGMDAANTWEVTYCRAKIQRGSLHYQHLPDYSDYWPLAARSYGHAIAGLGVLHAAGHSYNSLQLRALRRFFWHYLIARQLNDDAHDWQADLQSGHVNAVGAMMLRKWQQKHPGPVDVTAHGLKPLQTLFWQQAIERVCADIHHHVAIARQAIASVNWPHGSLLQSLVDPFADAADAALQGRSQAQDFIAGLAEDYPS